MLLDIVGLVLGFTADPVRSSKWSPDGRYEAHTETHDVKDGDTIVGRAVGLYVFDNRTKKTKLLYRRVDQGCPLIAGWWPHGHRILFWTYEYGASSANRDGSRLYDISVNGGRARLLGVAIEEFQSPLTFSHDGRKLLLTSGGNRFWVKNKRIAIIDVKSGAHLLTSRRIAAINPAWSRDERMVAFVATPDRRPLRDSFDIHRRFSRTHLWTVRSSGASARQLLNDPRFQESGPHWVTERRIQFTRHENGPFGSRGKLSYWEINADGSRLQRISEHGNRPK